MTHLFRKGAWTEARNRARQTKKATQMLPETSWAAETLPSGIPPEGHVVVTISRQFGSGGSNIGRLVAQGADLNYVDNQIISEVARRLGVQTQQAELQDEYTIGAVGHILEAIQANNLFTVHANPLQMAPLIPSQSQEIAYLHLTQKVILEIATRGDAVIMGRGSQFLLRSAPRTLHISIFAPLPYRIANVMRSEQIDHELAREIIEQRDYAHDSYLRRYYGNDGHQPGLYHLLLNTSLFSFDLAASLIRQALPVAQAIS